MEEAYAWSYAHVLKYLIKSVTKHRICSKCFNLTRLKQWKQQCK